MNDQSNYLKISNDINNNNKDKDSNGINNKSNISNYNQEKEKIDYNSFDNILLKKPSKERKFIKKNYSYGIINNNSKLEEYLKYFGSGINFNQNNNINSELISKVNYDNILNNKQN